MTDSFQERIKNLRIVFSKSSDIDLINNTNSELLAYNLSIPSNSNTFAIINKHKKKRASQRKSANSVMTAIEEVYIPSDEEEDEEDSGEE